jgi:hypothetical protein
MTNTTTLANGLTKLTLTSSLPNKLQHSCFWSQISFFIDNIEPLSVSEITIGSQAIVKIQMGSSTFMKLKPLLANKTIKITYTFDKEMFYPVDVNQTEIPIV